MGSRQELDVLDATIEVVSLIAATHIQDLSDETTTTTTRIAQPLHERGRKLIELCVALSEFPHAVVHSLSNVEEMQLFCRTQIARLSSRRNVSILIGEGFSIEASLQRLHFSVSSFAVCFDPLNPSLDLDLDLDLDQRVGSTLRLDNPTGVQVSQTGCGGKEGRVVLSFTDGIDPRSNRNTQRSEIRSRPLFDRDCWDHCSRSTRSFLLLWRTLSSFKERFQHGFFRSILQPRQNPSFQGLRSTIFLSLFSQSTINHQRSTINIL